MLKIFVDTNIFLHFKALGEISAKEIADEPFELWIPNKVIAELDKQKDGVDQKLKRRARTALNLIEKLEDGALSLPNGVVLNWYQDDPKLNWEEKGLNKDISDDLIIATMITFKERFSGDEIGLLSNDTGIRMKIKRHGIRKILPNPMHLLPEEPDLLKKELEELKRAALAEQNRKPIFEVVLLRSGSSVIPAKLEVNYSRRKQIPPSGFDAFIAEMTKGHKPIPEAASPYDLTAFRIEVAMGLTIEKRKSYNSAIKIYPEKLRQYLKDVNSYQERVALTVPIELQLLNKGGKPAGNVDVKFTLPFRGISMEVAKEPQLPPEPKKPAGNLLFDDSIAHLQAPDFSHIFENSKINSGGPNLVKNKDQSCDVSENFTEIKHHHHENIDRFYLTFPSVDAAKSFNIKYEITCREFAEKINGQIDIQVIVQ